MKRFNFFRAKRVPPASAARDRLQLLLQHERGVGGDPNLILVLREEILKAIAKHVDVASDKVRVAMRREDLMSTLEVEVDLPGAVGAKQAA
ncbi:cell division topological specificity factor [Pseudoxanthobacter soli DSM 19599]|uniref:Cell division topological specificity factor n=1 Tax=Pseudoxanthobacter soli DSM 19599 TaxID=1123029 RepID=A0A1M7ZS15_9HYPH|nr:cell division topological specificity factor MinE [Pseudoxanthobacter soli]SHO67446.1 cell division topological specificity factor [Pseudoxanthobacter soli DSM 19599]